MRKRTVLALFLSLVMSMSLFIGCGSAAGKADKEKDESFVAQEISSKQAESTKDNNIKETKTEKQTNANGSLIAEGETSSSSEAGVETSGEAATASEGGNSDSGSSSSGTGNSGDNGNSGGNAGSGENSGGGSGGSSGGGAPVETEAPTVAETAAPTQAPAQQQTAAVVAAASDIQVQETNSSGLRLVCFTSFTDSEKSTAQGIVASIINGSMSEYDKVKVIHDYLVNNIAYSSSITNSISNPIYHAAGAFAGDAVCQGYADAFNLLCYYAGIQTECVASESMSHAWNQVRINGNWYNIDVTWDDPLTHDGTQVRIYNYFLLSDADMGKDHSGASGENLHSCGSTYLGTTGNDLLSASFYAESLTPGYTQLVVSSVDDAITKYAAYQGGNVVFIFSESSCSYGDICQKMWDSYRKNASSIWGLPLSSGAIYLVSYSG